MSTLIDFYSGRGNDHRGRQLEEILAWEDERLEHTHDYIQWLFPLSEPSRFNPHAPLLTDADRAEFERRPDLQQNVLRSFRRMLSFYGFSLDEPSGDEVRATLVTPRPGVPHHWLSPDNHNYLRITRILTSLGLLGLAPYARAFLAALVQLYDQHSSVIGRETLGYWQRAVMS